METKKIIRLKTSDVNAIQERKGRLVSIYKYLEYEHAIQLLENKKLKFSDPTEWVKTDPYETKVYSAKYDIANRKNLPFPLVNKILITCFTEQYSCEAQWTAYCHSISSRPSIQIQFNIENLFSLLDAVGIEAYLGKVQYLPTGQFRDTAIQLLSSPSARKAFLSNNAVAPTHIKYLLKPLLLKRLAFSYEKEWRLFIVKGNNDNPVLIPNLTNAVEQIIVGHCDDKEFEEIKNDLSQYVSSDRIRRSSLKKQTSPFKKIIIK